MTYLARPPRSARKANTSGSRIIPAVLIDHGDVGQVVGGIAHRESSALLNLFSSLAAIR
jgi:hypothetical protein